MRILILLVLCLASTGCASYRHEKAVAEIRELQLECLKRQTADPTVDCSQFPHGPLDHEGHHR